MSEFLRINVISASDVADTVREILCFMIPIFSVAATKTANDAFGVGSDLNMNC